MTPISATILSIPSPFAAEQEFIKVLEPPDTDRQALLNCLLAGQYDKPFIIDDGLFRALYFSFVFVQSTMRVSQPNSLELAYTRKMMGFALFNPHPESILMLGLGGGSLAKFCHHHFPETKITVVEICPHVVAFRNEFQIPDDSDRFQVVVADAAKYVAACNSRFDVIVTDAFDKAGFADSISSRAFYLHLEGLLADNGILVANMAGQLDARMAHLQMLHDIFGEKTLAIPVGPNDNHVALAFRQRNFEPCWQTIMNQARLLGKTLGLDFEGIAQRFERSQKLGYLTRLLHPYKSQPNSGQADDPK